MSFTLAIHPWAVPFAVDRPCLACCDCPPSVPSLYPPTHPSSMFEPTSHHHPPHLSIFFSGGLSVCCPWSVLLSLGLVCPPHHIFCPVIIPWPLSLLSLPLISVSLLSMSLVSVSSLSVIHPLPQHFSPTSPFFPSLPPRCSPFPIK